MQFVEGQALLAVAGLDIQDAARDVASREERAPIEKEPPAEELEFALVIAAERRCLARHADGESIVPRIERRVGEDADESVPLQGQRPVCVHALLIGVERNLEDLIRILRLVEGERLPVCLQVGLEAVSLASTKSDRHLAQPVFHARSGSGTPLERAVPGAGNPFRCKTLF